MSATPSTDEKKEAIASSLRDVPGEDDDSVRVISRKKMDATLDFVEEYGAQVSEPTPEEDKKLFRKLLRRVFPILFVINFLMFADKNAIGFSRLMGMWEDIEGFTHARYEQCNSLFYAGYLIGQWPGHVLFQISNKRHFMTATLLTWIALMFGQLGAKNYQAILAIRVLLGVTEAAVTPCIEHTLGMFFTAKEQAVVNPIFWVGTVGVGIPTGFVAYGVEHYFGEPHPWKLYWIIFGGLTVFLAIWVALDYPDSPATYKAFSIEERVRIIRRIKKESRSSVVEYKVKKEQIWEAVKDPITWLFGLYACTCMLANNMNYQQQVISTSLGISRINSTFVTIAQGGYSTVVFILGSWIMTKWDNSLCWLSVIYNIPAILGGLLAVLLPWSNKIGILAGCIVVHSDGFGYILGLCWSQISSAGYTKRLVRTTLFMIGYGVANIIAPEMWLTGGPRYRPAWIVQLVIAWFGSSLILLLIRWILARRNAERRANLKFDEDGNIISKAVHYVNKDEGVEGGTKSTDISNFDLTDLENKEFIYPL